MRKNVISKGILLLSSALTLTLAAPRAQAGNPANKAFDWTNFVSDIPGVARHTDPLLVNPWGIVPGPEGAPFVAANGSGVIIHYTSFTEPKVIQVPSVNVSGTSSPTGIAYNYKALLRSGSNDFVITSGTVSKPAHVIAATEEGTIVAYNELVDPDNAQIVIDNSSNLARYKGIALSFDDEGVHRLYAVNFHSGAIETYDNTFQAVPVTDGTEGFNFSDPNAVSGYSPFNIKAVSFRLGRRVRHVLFVSYAKVDNLANPQDDLPGAGNGYINVFTPKGTLIKRLVDLGSPTPNDLNSPWGMAVARVNDAPISTAVLLVGSFGDGTIHAYRLGNLDNSAPAVALGALKDSDGVDLQFEGLWGIHFAHRPQLLAPFVDPDELNADETHLFFAAGLVGENDGLVGRIVK